VRQAYIKQSAILNYPLSSVATKHPVDVTWLHPPHIARGCRPANVTPTLSHTFYMPGRADPIDRSLTSHYPPPL